MWAGELDEAPEGLFPVSQDAPTYVTLELGFQLILCELQLWLRIGSKGLLRGSVDSHFFLCVFMNDLRVHCGESG